VNSYWHALPATIVFYCAAAAASPSGDVRLIGTWQGEYDEKDGSLKSWVQTRSENGTYQIEFRFVETDGAVHRLVEEGKWWIERDLFYEIAPSWMTQPDAYQYRFQEDGCIEFLLVASHESAEDVGHYRFVECLADRQPSI
jgi:hypothetical protein